MLGSWGTLDGWATAIVNDIGDNETPNDVGVVNLGQTAKAITAGGNHTCAILADNTVKCWGFGSNGQLGYGGSFLEDDDNIGDDEYSQ